MREGHLGLNDVDDLPAGLFAVIREVDFPATSKDAFLQRLQMRVKLRQRLVLDGPRPLSHKIGIGKLLPGFAVLLAERISESPQDLL